MTFNPAKLRRCPECGGGWPSTPDYALRGCAWLHGLPRKISPSNNELLIHDGFHGRNRFLQLELKGAREAWPPATGQRRTLIALAGQPNWTVLVLRGQANAVDVHRVTPTDIPERGFRTHLESVRQGIASWLNGEPWRADALAAATGAQPPGHVHGWARVDGVWSCVQDYYAAGYRPDTSCGEIMESAS